MNEQEPVGEESEAIGSDTETEPALAPGVSPFGSTFAALPFAHGGPLAPCRLRATAADFVVEESLGFAPDGEGDHLLLWVQKTDANTEWVARRLAGCIGARPSDLGYAGLKDRHAVTTQWFSAPRPRVGLPDWGQINEALAGDGVVILATHPHRRKLKRGVLAGNRFRIRLRGLQVDADAWQARLDQVRAGGVPNYFGEQRFGHDGANLKRVDALFRGALRRAPRHQTGLWLSAARSHLFNLVLAGRIRDATWASPLPGDCLNLAGSHAFFHAEALDDTLIARCAAQDLHPTGPLWGAGPPPTSGAVLDLETQIAEGLPGWAQGLAKAGLRQERRALRLCVPGLTWSPTDDGGWLGFQLPAGCYATTLLRELVSWTDGASG